MALTVFVAVGANTAGAQTMTATQLIDLLTALGIIPADKAAAARAAVASSATTTFTRDLTIGSTGADVTALQTTVGVSPATGYFGSITKAAVQAYQASKGIITTGYVGPLTRGALNGSVTTTTTTTTTTGTTGTVGIVNTGVEGTLSSSQSNAGVNSTVYEGQKMVSILGVQLEAKTSDISVQRVKIDLGTATTIYNKIYDTIYFTDGSTVLAQADLNSNTVVKDGGTYFITLAGFNSVIPRNTKKTYMVKVDVRPTVDSGDVGSRTVRLAANGIRGVDQAGIDQYTPASNTDVSRAVTVSASLAESASLTISTNANTPKKANVIAADGSSDNELDRVTLLLVDFKASKDNVKITDLIVDTTKTGTGGATASSTVYLYDGSTEIDSASVSSNSATFSDIDLVIPKDTTKTYTIKADIRNANGTLSVIGANIGGAAADVLAENTLGDSVAETGTATGENMNVFNVGPVVTLVSKSITTSGAPQANGTTTNVSTSTLSATFTVKIKAVGAALQFGTTASGSPMFSTTGSSLSFGVYRNGTQDTTISSFSTSTDWSTPSGVTTTGLTNTWSLSEGSEVTVPVTFTIQGRSATAVLTNGLYSVGLQSIQPSSAQADFMSGEADWRTSSVSFP